MRTVGIVIMSKLLKFVEVEFRSIFKKEVDKLCDTIKQLYNENSEPTYKSWEYTKLYSYNSDEYNHVIKLSDDEIKEKYKDNICLSQFKVKLPLSLYTDILYKYHDHKHLSFTIADKFEIELADHDTFITDTHTKILDHNIDLLQKINKSLNAIENHHFNIKCQTPLVDNFLSRVNQIVLLDDCCSDILQSYLAKGWRIISVCPQPNQRRPDYILGMVVDEKDIKKDARIYDTYP